MELIPVKKREVDTLTEFRCQMYCPADSVVMAVLEDMKQIKLGKCRGRFKPALSVNKGVVMRTTPLFM